MKSFYLHAGLPKTGTTTLQGALFKDHTQIFYLGKYAANNLPRGCLSKQAFEFLNPLLWNLDAHMDIRAHKDRYGKIIAESTEAVRAVVASWEILGTHKTVNFKKNLQRLKEVCGDVRLLVTLRNPLTWLPAEYLQKVRGQFTLKNQPLFRGRPFLEFETWLQRYEKNQGGTSRWLCFAENIQQATALLGGGNVAVFLFEDLALDPVAFYQSLARFMRIDTQQALNLLHGSHKNKRILQREIEYIKWLDSSFISRLQWNARLPHQRRRHLKLAMESSKKYSTPARVNFTDEWRDKVADRTRDGHRWLVGEFELDLKKHHYPL